MHIDDILPLPPLEIDGISKTLSDQETVDAAIAMIGDRRPDLLEKIAERERDDLEVEDASEDFFRFLREVVMKEIPIANGMVMTSIFWETRRRIWAKLGKEI